MLESRTTIALRWRDMDMLGHLNQAVYHELLEEGRSELLLRAQPQGNGAGWGWVVARVELDYRHEVRRDHATVEVVVRVAEVGRSSLVLDNDVVLPDGTVAAAGRTVLVGWDMAARGKRELSDAERELLTA
jgi:acyl-CoA thioester hydrolase